MGDYGTASGIVIGIDPADGKGKVLALTDGNIQASLSEDGLTWAGGKGRADNLGLRFDYDPATYWQFEADEWAALFTAAIATLDDDDDARFAGKFIQTGGQGDSGALRVLGSVTGIFAESESGRAISASSTYGIPLILYAGTGQGTDGRALVIMSGNVDGGGGRYTNMGNATVATDGLNRQTGDARYAGIAYTDHGALAGLGDDDHSQYLLATGARAGSTSQAQNFGATGIKADVIAESTTNAGTRIAALLADKLNKNILLVDPGAAGAYTTVASALTAITDASSSNEYVIVVRGKTAEAGTCTWKEDVHMIILPGGALKFDSTSSSSAVNITGLTNAILVGLGDGPHILRTGAAGNNAYTVNISGGGAGVKLIGLAIENTTTVGIVAHTVRITSGALATVDRCRIVGSGNGHGIFVDNGAMPMILNNYIVGGTGNNRIGVRCQTGAAPVLRNNTIIGGGAGTSCLGLSATSGARPRVERNTIIGGGADSRGMSVAVSASSRQEDALGITGSHPWRLVAAAINVTAAAAGGVTLTLRDAASGGGNALSAALAVDATGWIDIPITGHRIISAGAFAYAYLSASDATLAYTIYLTYEHCYTTCYGLHLDSTAAVQVIDCTIMSNAASTAIYVSNNGDDAGMIIGGTAWSGLNDAGRPKAITCQSSWSPGQVYNMVLAGGSTNLIAAVGTANGTNTEI